MTERTFQEQVERKLGMRKFDPYTRRSIRFILKVLPCLTPEKRAAREHSLLRAMNVVELDVAEAEIGTQALVLKKQIYKKALSLRKNAF